MKAFFPERKSYGVLAVRGPASIMGPARAWLKENGEPISFATLEEAQAYASLENKLCPSPHVQYLGAEMKKGVYQ